MSEDEIQNFFKRELTHENVISYIVNAIRDKESTQYNGYGYELYLPKLIRSWFSERYQEIGATRDQAERYLPSISVYFYPAAWDLCRRGILRPGVSQHGAQSTDDGNGGNGYCITPFGMQWLKESTDDAFVPTEPERFGQMIKPFETTFGRGFTQRANEAIRCYGAHAYLACCVMCGAASESILLHLAIQKTNNEQLVLKDYKRAKGRSTIENLIKSGLTGSLQRDFDSFFYLIKYWRDESGHGEITDISDNEAFTSLALLLRCAKYSQDNYSVLTTQ